MTWTANENYWGAKALTPNLEFRWSDQSAQRLIELQSSAVDGIDNPGTADIPNIAPWLTLDGLRILWELNQPKDK